MTKRTKARLYGAIRLIPEDDTIGICVFSEQQRNNLFIAETDLDLRIVRFLEFYNEDGYTVSTAHASDAQISCEIGEPVPIPFWVDGVAHLAGGHLTRAELIARFSNHRICPEVVVDLAEILHKARGHYRQLDAQRQADEIAARFSDVFHEPPVHSKYWISRYRVALANARSVAEPPHPVDAHLRSVADEWFARFGFKTSARKMLAMLGESGDGIFTEDEMRGICFAFLLQKLAGQDLRDVEEIARQPLFRMLFPNGLYRHYTAAGYPTVSFKFSRPSDFTAAFREELYSGQRDGDFARVLRLAKLFFGTEDLPEELAAIAGPFLRERIARFGAEVEHAFNEVFKNREYADGWKDLARQLLANYDAMQKLDPT